MSKIKQDMPPVGGFNPIAYKRVPPATSWPGIVLIGGFIGMTIGSAYLYRLNYIAVHRRELEMRGAILALYPMLLAERDRAFLKQCRINREEERDLMKNVPGWKVGTWYGEPIYLGADPDKFIEPKISEFYVHSNYKDMKKRFEITLLS